MGLPEHQLAGAFIGRRLVELESEVGYQYYTGSTSEMGKTFIILSARTTNAPARIRLYTNSSSRDLPAEISRSFESSSVQDSVGLISDISFSSVVNFNIDPMVYGASLEENGEVYFTIETQGNIANNINISTFLLEDYIDAVAGTEYPVSNRRELILESDSMVSGARFFGSASICSASNDLGALSVPTPRTYLLLSASSFPNPVSQSCRVRLYSIPFSLVPASEISRSFTEPFTTSGSGLIADFLMESGAVHLPFKPMVFGASIEPVVITQNLLGATVPNEIYYVIDNLHTASVQHNVHLNIYSLED